MGRLKPQDYQRMEDLVDKKLLEAESLLETKFNESIAHSTSSVGNTSNDTTSTTTTATAPAVSSKEADMKKEMSSFEFQEAKQSVNHQTLIGIRYL